MRLLFWLLSSLFKLEIVKRDGVPYLWRWHIVKTRWGGLYLHHFLKGDNDPDPHDHPWPFWTFILKGGYTDETHYKHTVSYQKCKPFRLYHRPPTHIHRVLLPEGMKAWTLVFLGKKVQEWGFYTPNGFVHHSEYNKPNDGRVSKKNG